MVRVARKEQVILGVCWHNRWLQVHAVSNKCAPPVTGVCILVAIVNKL